MDGLSIFALILLISIFLIVSYGMIIIHDVPYHIAQKRNHPHQDAIHVAGWVSLFTLHVIWPFLWIWATIYRPERGYGFGGGDTTGELRQRVEALEAEIAGLKGTKEAATSNKQA